MKSFFAILFEQKPERGILRRSGAEGLLGCHLSANPGESPTFVCNTIPMGLVP